MPSKFKRLVIYGMPGTPIYELGNFLSDFFGAELYIIQRNDINKAGDMYFADKIPEVRFDTGDLNAGSESKSMIRDPGSEDKNKAMENVSRPYIFPLTNDEKSALSYLKSGILCTEVPDDYLADWGDGFVFLDADEENAIRWFKDRRKCFTCGTVFHMQDRPSKVPGICDRCGTDLQKKYEDQSALVANQFYNWKRDFKKFLKITEKCPFIRIKVDKQNSFDDISRKVYRWVRKRVRRPWPKDWYYSVEVNV